MPVPAEPKIYHIVHVDRLASIVASDHLWCDATMSQRGDGGTSIGMGAIKQRRLTELTLASHPDLSVGDCVPFYFCPRSVMLYVVYRGDHPELTYRGGQSPIVHLESDLRQTIAWADEQRKRWAFTTSNAGARYFDDYSDLACLDQIDWDAVQARNWVQHKEGKQAEFLIEGSFPWNLVLRVGVRSRRVYDQAKSALQFDKHRPRVEIKCDWYY